MNKKLLVIGLDCATGDIVFEHGDKLPHLRGLMERGVYGTLTSSDPPITIPAWMVMATGKDPGALGIYGFRHRTDYSYDKMWIANSRSFHDKAVWDMVGDEGGESILVSIPPSYPVRPVKGGMISCFITPDTSKEYTYPAELRGEIESRFGPYMFDVEFRIEDKAELLQGIYKMTEQRFEIMKDLIVRKPWNLFWFVEIGVDRVHHGFWKFMDRDHHLYAAGNPFESAILDYYVYIDRKIGDLLKLAGEDTAVLVVSDHGAKRMKGCFCVNEWLIEQGDLRLKQMPEKPVTIEKLDVDWPRTKAWAWGGYYARVFLNVEGREPQGIIPPGDYEKERDALAERILGIKGPDGEAWATRVIKPQEHYAEANGDYPDLMVYFDDLYWRSAGTLGHGRMYLLENDTGPDDAVHAKEGMYILSAPGAGAGLRRDADILDIAPTVLRTLGVAVPQGLRGKPVV
ncbi:MAG: alkaline phosphatase family protein [Acidobacteriota bacterium]|nr:alkaline phosphatase family protein [Acidobacteriota bacterium]